MQVVSVGLDDVRCSGKETSIADCGHSSWGIHNCKHAEDVSVSCITVRLVGGPGPQEGRLEVQFNGTWGTVCDDYFNTEAARVVCVMLGYGNTGHAIGNRYGAGGGPIWLDDVQCSGTETHVKDCRHRRWGSHNCKHSEDVSVSCLTEVRARLIGGPSPLEGRLEVYHNGTWGSVCDDYFNWEAAKVVCFMLGNGYTGRTIGNSYGAGYGTIWLDDVRCRGTETNIADCPHRWWGSHNCRHSEDVSISCVTEVEVTVRLVGGPSLHEGRLEVYHDGEWGTVCDGGFTDAAATVACYSLGFGYVGRKTNAAVYGVGKGEIWLDGVDCNGTESHIGECSHTGWGVHGNCSHDEDVAVSCAVTTTASPRVRSTTTPVKQFSVSPTSTINPNASIHAGQHRYMYTTRIAAATVVSVLVVSALCIGLSVAAYRLRNADRERKEADDVLRRVRANDNVRPPADALAVPDKPPTYDDSVQAEVTPVSLYTFVTTTLDFNALINYIMRTL